MALSLVQPVFLMGTFTPATVFQATATNPISAGSIVVLAGMIDPAGVGGTLSNDKSDSVTDSGTGFVTSQALWLSWMKAFFAPTVGAQVFTFTSTNTAGYASIYGWEVSGFTAGTASYDKAITNSAASGTAASAGPTSTLAQANEFGCSIGETTDAFTGAGVTSPWVSDGVNGGTGGLGQHVLTAATTALTATGTLGNSAQWFMNLSSIKGTLSSDTLMPQIWM